MINDKRKTTFYSSNKIFHCFIDFTSLQFGHLIITSTIYCDIMRYSIVSFKYILFNVYKIDIV